MSKINAPIFRLMQKISKGCFVLLICFPGYFKPHLVIIYFFVIVLESRASTEGWYIFKLFI